MPTTSPIQAIPVPVSADDVDIPGDLMGIAQAVESRLVMRFLNSGARDSAIPSPVEGMMCYLTGPKWFQFYSDGAWFTMWTGGAPGSGEMFRPVLSYQSRPALGLVHGMVGINRPQNRLEAVNGSGQWRGAAAYATVAFQEQRHGGGGVSTAPSGQSLSVDITITTTDANTDVWINGVSEYALRGVFEYLGVAGGYQEVTTILYVVPPSSGNVELRRWVARHMNTGTGSGPSPVGGPTAKAIPVNWLYRCTVAGNYTFRIVMVVGTGVGNVSNYGGEIMVQPVYRTATF